MKLFFLYGPPAVGKLTIANELTKRTALPLVDNHAIINPVYRVFGWDHPERKRLVDQFRIELFQSAAKAGISLITTFGGGGETYNAFIQKVVNVVRENDGEVVFIHLTAPREVLLERGSHESRSVYKSMMTPEIHKKRLEETPDMMASALVGPHLEIDTSLHTSEESAEIIIKELGLARLS